MVFIGAMAMGDVDQGIKRQCYKRIDVNTCLRSECKKMCIRRFKKAGAVCVKSDPSAQWLNQCRCVYHC